MRRVERANDPRSDGTQQPIEADSTGSGSLEETLRSSSLDWGSVQRKMSSSFRLKSAIIL